MRPRLWFAVLGFSLACNANPLLKNLTSNFTPLKAGSHWVYGVPDGSLTVTRQVMGTVPYAGRMAFHFRDSYSNGLPASNSYRAWGAAGALDQYSVAEAAWVAYRRLPYVTGNHWALSSSVPNISADVKVEAIEDVRVAAGAFANCFRLKTKVFVYDSSSGITTTTESLVWAAPDVGDVRYASVDLSGTVTTTLELGSYNLVP